jgi:hypothetical protein
MRRPAHDEGAGETHDGGDTGAPKFTGREVALEIYGVM